MSGAQKRELLASLLAVLVSGATVLTCSALGSRGSGAPPVAATTAASALPQVQTISAPVVAAASAPVIASVALPTSATVAAIEVASRGGELRTPDGNAVPAIPRFYEALAALEAKRRSEPVRIAWLGDSHTQADFWTQALRGPLQARFGRGGPGFVHVGWSERKCRHSGVRFQITGNWLVIPATLVSPRKVEDGIFGLGGVRFTPRQADCRASLSVGADVLASKGKWDVALRLVQPSASATLSIAAGPQVTVRAQDRDAPPPGEIRHVLLESAGPGGTLEVAVSGDVEMMGAVIESAEPGVVMDTLGLNGARVASALAIEEASWVKEMARRAPDLVILAYGSNESSDLKIDPARHANLVMQLVRRVRAAAPKSECLIIGPMDRGGERYEDAVQALNEAQRQAATSLGCAFWSAQLGMGGKGSIARWDADKLVAADLLHLLAGGYEKLGATLLRDLMRGYDRSASKQTPTVQSEL